VFLIYGSKITAASRGFPATARLSCLRFFQNPKSRDFLRFFAVFRTFSRSMVEKLNCPSTQPPWILKVCQYQSVSNKHTQNLYQLFTDIGLQWPWPGSFCWRRRSIQMSCPTATCQARRLWWAPRMTRSRAAKIFSCFHGLRALEGCGQVRQVSNKLAVKLGRAPQSAVTCCRGGKHEVLHQTPYPGCPNHYNTIQYEIFYRTSPRIYDKCGTLVQSYISSQN